MTRWIQTAALAMVLALGFTSTASAAFVQATISDTGALNEFLVEVFVMVEQDRTISTVDVGIEADGATFSDIESAGSFFDGQFLGPANALQQAGRIAFFSGSALAGKAASALTPFSLGTVVMTLSRTADAGIIISPDVLYAINATTGDIRTPTSNPGDSLTPRIEFVPEPAAIVLLGLALAGLSVRRRA